MLMRMYLDKLLPGGLFGKQLVFQFEECLWRAAATRILYET